MNIRLETPEDYREVEELTREAFWNVYAPGCVEHFVLHHYRSNPDFIPELDFVMEEDGRIIGHVMYSKAEIICEDGSGMPAWTFGPISIHPDYKRKGYGLKLLNYSIEKARELGIGVPYFLAKELIPGYLNGVEGTYHTPQGYYIAFENPEAFNEFEAKFPPKEKKHQEGQIVDDCTMNPNGI